MGVFFFLGGKSHDQFLQEAIERSSPANARFLTELFGGIKVDLDLGEGAQVGPIQLQIPPSSHCIKRLAPNFL